jgi:diguanylate cyclase
MNEAPKPENEAGAAAVMHDSADAEIAALAASEARFRVLSESSPSGVFHCNALGECTYTNGRLQRMFGLDSQDFNGEGWVKRIHPEDISRVYQGWRECTAYGTEFNAEFRVQLPGGTVRFFRARARPVTDVKERTLGFVGSVEDVTDERLTLDRLKTSQDRLRTLYEATPAMMHSIDVQGRLTTVSDLWLAKLGYSREEVTGRKSTDFLTPESGARAQNSVLPDFFKRGYMEDVEYQMVTRTGEVLDVLMSAILERDEVGHPLRSLAVTQDVTARRRAERALFEERQRLAYLVEGTRAGTWEWNVQTGETRFNEQWAQIVGYRLDELDDVSMQAWYDRAHPVDLERSEEILKRHYARELPTYECEVRLRHRGGHWVWVLSRGRVQTWTDDGKPEWMFGVDIEITALKDQEEALRKSQTFLNRAGEVAGVGGWELDLASGALVWSDETYRIYGVKIGQPPLKDVWQFLSPDGQHAVRHALRAAIRDGKSWDLEHSVIRAGGEIVWVRSLGAVECEDGHPARLVGTLQDITEARRLRAELAEQHELLRVTLQSIADAVITTDSAGRVVWLNPVAERMTGWSNPEAHDQPLASVFHLVDEATRQPVACGLPTQWPEEKPVKLAERALLLSRNGEEFGIDDTASPMRNGEGRVLGAVLVFRDVSEQRRRSGEMNYRATHDALTGLVNRAEFETRLRRVLQDACDNHSEHALLCIDLDQFKSVNDACGHAVGDELLKQVGRLFTESIRHRDTPARLGGDEFAVILEHCSLEQAQRLAQEICDRTSHLRFNHDGRNFSIGASIGLVPVHASWASAQEILKAADASCFAAKEAGRGRVHTWFDTDTAVIARQDGVLWSSRIEKALADNRFVLQAQHICPLGAEVAAGMAELLVRMVDEEGALLLPGAFFPAAERFNLVSRIDRWVLRETLERIHAGSGLDSFPVLSLNLSGESIGDRAFHRYALDLLAQAGPRACQRICLEIAESTALGNMADTSAFIRQARPLGVKVALDRFGVGASSFHYLAELSVDYLKIDGQFIRGMIDDELHEAAVRSFVDVARIVGLKTIALHVDNPQVLTRLRDLGVDYAQGFLIHRPVLVWR